MGQLSDPALLWLLEVNGEWTAIPFSSGKDALTQTRFYQHPRRWQETDGRDLEKKKMITAWVQATHVWSCISIWDIVLSVSLRESLHPLGKVSLLEVIILWVCLLFSSTSVLPAVRTEEESLWYVPFLREGKGHGAREWLSRILLKQLVISG